VSFDESKLIIGHRGAAGLEPENTLPSFIRAVSLGVDAVELDVHVCDNRLCVIHDSELTRTTNGSGRVSERTLRELRQLDAGNGAQIPFLEEVFDVIPEHIGINVELKGPGTAAPLAEFLRRYPARDVLVSSFRHDELAQFFDLAPDAPIAPLFDRWHGDPIAVARSFRSRFVNISRKIAGTEQCSMLQDAGFSLLVYTVNRLANASTLFASGISGVFTDYPDRIRPVVPGGQSPA